VTPGQASTLDSFHPYLVLEDLLLAAGRPPWDLLLIGDGSGTDIDHPAGWAVVSIERQTGSRHVQLGSYSNATVNYVEADCYLHALRYDLYRRMGGKLKVQRRVVIFSDSQVTVNTGNGLYRQSYHPELWCMYDFFRKIGYQITFYSIPRETHPLHQIMDKLSRSCRTTSIETAAATELVNALMPRTDSNV